MPMPPNDPVLRGIINRQFVGDPIRSYQQGVQQGMGIKALREQEQVKQERFTRELDFRSTQAEQERTFKERMSKDDRTAAADRATALREANRANAFIRSGFKPPGKGQEGLESLPQTSVQQTKTQQATAEHTKRMKVLDLKQQEIQANLTRGISKDISTEDKTKMTLYGTLSKALATMQGGIAYAPGSEAERNMVGALRVLRQDLNLQPHEQRFEQMGVMSNALRQMDNVMQEVVDPQIKVERLTVPGQHNIQKDMNVQKPPNMSPITWIQLNVDYQVGLMKLKEKYVKHGNIEKFDLEYQQLQAKTRDKVSSKAKK